MDEIWRRREQVMLQLAADPTRGAAAARDWPGLDEVQRAMLNIVEDMASEKARLEQAQKAALNVLQDYADEKKELETTQRAMLNILEDFEIEKAKVEQANFELTRQIGERSRAEAEVRRLNEDLERRVETRTEQLRMANKELEAFAYTVSHDLRAPLRSMDGFSQALLEDYGTDLPAPAHEHLERIRSAAQRMARLMDDLLELSRLSRTPLQLGEVNLSDLASAVLDELQRTEPQRSVRSSIAPNLVARGDAGLLEIVMRNVIGNAWKFTSHSHDVLIEVGRVEHEQQPTFFVRDNGVGFDMNYVDKIFAPFQRLHTANDFPGTGIGLATVHRIIEKHGGRVWAEGAVERGAAIYFTLPEDKA